MGLKPLHQIQEYNQSIWLDNIERVMITSGALKKMIDNGLLGMTSNPTIFEKAISGSKAYDEQMQDLMTQEKGIPDTLDGLMIKDVQMAADEFRPVYDRTKGRDGYVSIEISPKLAYQTGDTVRTVKELHRAVNRDNVMIKVPSTPQGVSAVEELIGDGISINVTLIFSIDTYEQVAKAYVAGLRRLSDHRQTLKGVRSVASVFVSRVDTLVDKMIQERLKANPKTGEKAILQSLMGKVAVANSRLIYKRFKEIFSEEEFQKLQKQGGHVQRPLWGSTGTKNPNYSDLLYVEELIGRDTVNTIPSKTLNAFEDHGKLRHSLEEDVETSRTTLSKLAEVGIDLGQVTKELQEKGVKAFEDSYDELIKVITAKRNEMLSERKGS